jgi:peptidoglycan/xylan/chitin deacetylase (PgdA/CDA1 family)
LIRIFPGLEVVAERVRPRLDERAKFIDGHCRAHRGPESSWALKSIEPRWAAESKMPVTTSNLSVLRRSMKTVPILAYHSISNEPAPWIRRFSVAPEMFLHQLELILDAGATALTISAFADVVAGKRTLPERPVVITFDDGLSDFRDEAIPLLRQAGLVATLYVTTGFLNDADRTTYFRPAGPWLDSRALVELHDQGVEIGAHSHTHPQLDTVSPAVAREEIETSKDILEQLLQEPVRSFAYPHGFLNRTVRRLVRESGYESACGCRNALSSTSDDPLALARLLVRRTTSPTTFAGWLDGRGVPIAPVRESVRTRAWRSYRRGRAFVRRRPGYDWG